MLNDAHRDRGSEDVLEVSLTGQMLLDHPLLNKGSSFPEDERRAFHLLGLLPHHVTPVLATSHIRPLNRAFKRHFHVSRSLPIPQRKSTIEMYSSAHLQKG
jgi:hypothetical protein